MIAAVLCTLLLITASAAGSKHGRVINGFLGDAEIFSSIVRLRLVTPTDTTWCSGNLFNDRWILTAAHCLHNTLSVRVGLGGNVRLNPIRFFDVSTNNMYIHPNFNPSNWNNDIALIEIPPVTFTKYIKAIPLSIDTSETYADKNTYVAGWGQTDGAEGAPLAPVLQYAQVKVLDDIIVVGATKDDKVCIDTRELGTSTCKGDSGGPLIVQEPNGQIYLIGVTSFGNKNCKLGYAACFARVSKFVPWIRQIMG